MSGRQWAFRASLIALSTGLLAACTTTSPYVGNNEPGIGAPKPNFPVVKSDAPPPPPPPPPPVATAPRPPAAVSTQPLAPPSGAVASAPIAPPASSTPFAPSVAPPPPLPAVATAPQFRAIAAGPVVDGERPGGIYTVKPGQGVDAIARELGLTRQVLVDLNGLQEPYSLRPGQQLRTPGSGGAVGKAYVVQQGDTLFAIGRRFSVTAVQIAAANGMSLDAGIRPGQKVILPPGVRDVGPGRVQIAAATPAPTVAATAPRPVVVASAPPAAPDPLPPPPPPPPPPTSSGLRPTIPAPTNRPATPPPAAVAAPTPAPPPPAAAPQQQLAQALALPPAKTPPVSLPPAQPNRPATTIIPTSPPPSAAQLQAIGRGRFAWPLRGRTVSGFGVRGTGQRNDGINIAGGAGTPVKAAAAGKVVYVGSQIQDFGNLVLIQHDGGFVTAYAHLAGAQVKNQDMVTQGQVIGDVGQTGSVAEPQLHFEIRYAPTPRDRAEPVDPALLLPN